MVKWTVIFMVACLWPEAQAARVDARQKSQRARVHQGNTSGALTAGEAAQLKTQQARIRRGERRARADGTVTEEESARLEARQDAASKNLQYKKNNGRTAR